MAKQKGGVKNAAKVKFLLPANEKKRTCKPVTTGLKLRALEMFRQGTTQQEISHVLEILKSTLWDIVKNKDILLKRSGPSTATKFYKLFNDLELHVSE
jgi:hypothetical protein